MKKREGEREKERERERVREREIGFVSECACYALHCIAGSHQAVSAVKGRKPHN